MESQTLTNWRNKVKRLVIEFHHHKNKTTYRKSVIQGRDRSKPLMTLRTQTQYTDTTDQDALDSLFEGFSCVAQQPEEDDMQHLSNGISRGVFETLKHMVSSMRRQNSDVLLGKNHRASGCVCHQEDLDHIDPNFFHLGNCMQGCSENNLRDRKSSQELVELLMEHGVKYIEASTTKKKSRLRRMMKWFQGTQGGTSTIMRNVCPNDVPVHKVSGSTKNIEIVTESHGYISPLNTPNDILDSYFEPQGDQLQSQAHDVDPHNQKLLNFSSYSRKHLKNTTSMVSLARNHSTDGFCACATCEKRQQQMKLGLEPWKVVMNDISLYAALLSTGTKPTPSIASSQKVVLDFTQSKHQQPGAHKFFHTGMEYGSSLLNDENLILDTDLLDLSGIELPLRSKSLNGTVHTTEQQIHTLLRPHSVRPNSKLSILTGKPLCGETSPQYQDVLLDYNYYSDED